MTMNNNKNINIIITGVGGQGNVSLSRLLGDMILDDNNFVTIGETFGASQRGGSVMSHLRITEKDLVSPVIPAKKADLIIGLEPIETIRVLTTYGNPEVKTISNTWSVMPVSVLSGENRYPEKNQIDTIIKDLSFYSFSYNFTKMGAYLGHHMLSNSIILGFLSQMNIQKRINEEVFKKTALNHLPKNTIDKNIIAFSKGIELFKENNKEIL